MIEVFKTNIQELSQATRLIALLLNHFPDTKINVDLHDCDKVLRIEGHNFAPTHVMTLVREHGFMCNVLE